MSNAFKSKEYTNSEFSRECMGTASHGQWLAFLMYRDGFNKHMPYTYERTSNGRMVTQSREYLLRDRPITGVSFEQWQSGQAGGAI